MTDPRKNTPQAGPQRASNWSEPTAKRRLGSRVEALDRAMKGRAATAVAAKDLTPTLANGGEGRSQWFELKEQAIMAFESGLLPRSVDNRQKAITIALMGREFGLSPMQALCGIYVVNGMAALRGSLMLRLIYERVNGAMITVVTPPEKAHLECEVEMKRPGGKAHVFRFSVEDARKAGFMNKPIWQQHTSTMLRWAAIRTGARVVFADAIAGAYMEDEIQNAATNELGDKPDVPAVPMRHLEELAQRAANAEARATELLARVEAGEPVKNAPPANLPSVETDAKEPATPARIEVRSLPLFKPVTEKQINRLYAIAHGKHWTRQDVGIWMEKWFKKRDPKELNRIEYDKLCNFLLSSQAKKSASGEAEA